MQFISIDVETANPSMGSICQIGIARFIDGRIAEQWSFLIDPEEYFDDFKSRKIHGIYEPMVAGKPKLPEIAEEIRALLESGITVSHSNFDRTAITRAFKKYDLAPIATSWLDTIRVARSTWKEFAHGYGLSPLCKKIGYEFKHHDALEDAKAAGEVLLAAIRESKIDLDSWMKRVGRPIRAKGATIPGLANPEGSLFGEVIVFTGTLELERVDAAILAASVGCKVGESVTKKTTILVIGDQDFSKFGHEKRRKQRRAEELIEEGFPIRIIYESDFLTLVGSAQ